MSHPVPGHFYGEDEKPKSSKGKALNAAQKSFKKMNNELKKGNKKKGESPLQHLKRLTK